MESDSVIKYTEDQLQKTPQDSKSKQRVFTILVLINTLLNYDTGVIPASLPEIQKTLHLTYKEQAAIGSLVYIGLCISSLSVSIVFQKYSAQKILTLMLLLNCIFCFLFSISYNTVLMCIARTGMGFTQAYSVIYAPVWTNVFAPSKKCTSWLGILQCAVPLGIVLGYSIASLCNTLNIPYLNWRFAIQLQALLEIPLIVLLKSTHKDQIDIVHPEFIVSPGEISARGEEIRIDSISLSHFQAFWVQLKMLSKNPVFVLLTSALCCLFFVVSGIQYWVSLYMNVVLEANKVTIIIGFVVISTTAPILGVLSGGYIADYYGGYKGENVLRALKICIFFGTLAFIVAIPAGVVSSVSFEVIFLWLLLFFGGCVLPSAMGIIVNSVPREFQSSSSAVSQLVFNLGGYFLAPVLSALLMDQFKSEKEALKFGFRFVLSVSLLSLGFVVLTYYSIWNCKDLAKEHLEESGGEGEAGNSGISLEELNHELALRIKPIIMC